MNQQEKLQQLIGELLERQPPQRAPGSLQARVLTIVQAREAVVAPPKGFIHWPRLAQVLFTLVALMAVKLTLLGAEWGMNTLDRALDATSLYEGVVQEVSWIWTLAEAVITSLRSIPEGWLWGTAALVVAVYLSCLTISAVAYRALYAR